jgi:hypothetical protein
MAVIKCYEWGRFSEVNARSHRGSSWGSLRCLLVPRLKPRPTSRQRLLGVCSFPGLRSETGGTRRERKSCETLLLPLDCLLHAEF